MVRIVTVQGMQWGSEAKGAIASLIAQLWNPDTVACAWMPNAGHTAYINGVKYVHSMLPLSALAASVESILIGPGAVVDIDKLTAEINFAGPDRLEGKELIIHPRAAVLLPQDSQAERDQGLISIGSTMKGSMAATIRKMQRGIGGVRVMDDVDCATLPLSEACHTAGLAIYVDTRHYEERVALSERMLLEGAQGFGLGLHERFYPYCTSRDVSTAQLLADCRIPVGSGHIINVGVARTFPIRVANRYDDKGKMIGTSGGFYSDQKELEWHRDLSREPELTTVTKLPRRIFSWSRAQIRDAVRVMRPDYMAMTFCDYLGKVEKKNTVTGSAWTMDESLRAGLRHRKLAFPSVPLAWVTTGPEVQHAWHIEDFDYGRVHPADKAGVPWE